MITILYITSTLKRTGPTNVLLNLLLKLNKNNFKPIILTLSNEDSNYPSLYSTFEKIGVKIIPLSLNRINGFLFGTGRIKRVLQKNSINIIHIFGFRGDLLINKTNFPGIKVISTINSNIYEDYTMLYGRIKGSVMAKFHMNSLKGKIAIGCSNFVTTQLNNKYNSELETIYNGIPKESYIPPNSQEKIELRDGLLLDVSAKIFIFVGYLIYRKDPLTTIQGFLSAESADELILLMIGDGPLMEECKALANQFPNRKIFFLGNQPETLKYLKCADYYIASSYSEGLPTSVMEAMSCGLPVILSNIQPHIELVDKIKDWKYLFGTNDSQMLAANITSILKESHDKLSLKCRSVIEDKINSEIMANKYETLYLKN
jgi:glycosyltransferase involved in cell wall biosynthesis